MFDIMYICHKNRNIYLVEINEDKYQHQNVHPTNVSNMKLTELFLKHTHYLQRKLHRMISFLQPYIFKHIQLKIYKYQLDTK